MTIYIHRPELEALIVERMKSGAFEDIEDVLLQALKASTVPAKKEDASATGADLVAVMQSSPYREIDIQPVRSCMPVRDVMF
ncbi:MAG TPA: hypothetical protein VG488_04025 [Candidatus Angelobacter sp.]|jgi:hypothetical protein|nr:hypothetical protein [Candidatus Angelobacter sp.]